MFVCLWILHKIETEIQIERREYQLFGITSLLIASKFEDI